MLSFIELYREIGCQQRTQGCFTVHRHSQICMSEMPLPTKFIADGQLAGTYHWTQSLMLLLTRSLDYLVSSGCLIIKKPFCLRAHFSFHFWTFAYVSNRDMSSNPITYISVGAFAGLSSLQSLYVSDRTLMNCFVLDMQKGRYEVILSRSCSCFLLSNQLIQPIRTITGITGVITYPYNILSQTQTSNMFDKILRYMLLFPDKLIHSLNFKTQLLTSNRM